MKGKVLKNLELYSNDSCTSCICVDGELNCTEYVCPDIQCGPFESPGFISGECCQICIPKPVIDPPYIPIPSCQQEGEFTDPYNSCLRCFCHRGQKACMDISGICDTISNDCEKVVYPDGQCCPVCEVRKETSPGISQSISYQDCSTVRCPSIDCPTHQIPKNVPGQCCRACVSLYPQPERCVEKTTKRGNDPCERCRCIRGAFKCYKDPRICPRKHQNYAGEVLFGDPSNPSCVERSTQINRETCERCMCIGGAFQCYRDPRICTQIHAKEASFGDPSNPSCVEKSTQVNRETCERCMCIGGAFQCYRDPRICTQTHQNNAKEASFGDPNNPSCVKGSTQVNRETCERCMCIGGAFQCYRDPSVCPQSQASRKGKVVLPKIQFITKTQRNEKISYKLNQDGVEEIDIEEVNEEPKYHPEEEIEAILQEQSSTHTNGIIIVLYS